MFNECYVLYTERSVYKKEYIYMSKIIMVIFSMILFTQVHGNISQKNIEEIFENVTENMHPDASLIERYFSPLYQQDVDGHRLDYNGFLQHMIKQKSMVKSVKITIERCVVEENKICTIHRVDVVKNNKQKVVVKVIAYFEFDSDGKLIICDELTHVLEGTKEDRELGSVK